MTGRIREISAVPLLTRSLDHDDEIVCSQAALSLLRMGERGDVINHCINHKSPLLALGLGGGKPEVLFFTRLAKDQAITREIVISLGILGDICAVPILIDSLDREDLAEPAADALELITGAGIEESNFIPDPIDKKELFKNEVEKLEKGENPYSPGQEPGVTVQGPCQNPDIWRQWFEENQEGFMPETRYRNGSPCSPKCLVNNMKSTSLPRYLRQLAYEEMVIRYQKDIPFETDRPASFQARAIEQYENWIQTSDNSYQKGQWYFAGRLMT